jgi:hypothetical protein
MTLIFDPDQQQVQHNNSLETRRFGRIFFSQHLLETASEAVQKIFSKIIPIDVRYDFARAIFDVTALSDEFEPVEPGYVIPYYTVQISIQKRKAGTGKAYYFNFEKLEGQ